MHQRRRQRINELRVIHDEDQVRYLFQRVVRVGEHCRRLPGRVDGHRAIERPQRHGPTGLGAQDESHRPPVGPQGIGKVASQGRFADPTRPDQCDAAARRAVVKRRQGLAELVVAGHQWPSGTNPAFLYIDPLTCIREHNGVVTSECERTNRGPLQHHHSRPPPSGGPSVQCQTLRYTAAQSVDRRRYQRRRAFAAYDLVAACR